MSGGSYNYIYSKLSIECEGEMRDEEMNAMIKDLCEVLHDLEWWQSGDYSEDQYRETVSEFKKKWFKNELAIELSDASIELFNKDDSKKMFIDVYNYLAKRDYGKMILNFENGASMTVEIHRPAIRINLNDIKEGDK